MIILFGFRRRIARLGTAFLLCPHCQTPAAQVVSRVRRYFTVFFIPIIPLGGKYVVTCTMCGRGTQVGQETAEAYLAPVQPPQGPALEGQVGLAATATATATTTGSAGPPAPLAQPGPLADSGGSTQPEGPGHQP
jgi:hypothetical protein